ncbi:MAG: molybdate ABC transporter permease subunit [Lachnospiraceae bacterium]|nr:molybdate ABC transporter permease subunit [Lachnospiraceae bacterium]
MDYTPLWISVKVAICATVFTFFLGLPAARLVVNMRKFKGLIDGIFSLPMVLPPTVVGFFLLILFGRNSAIGKILEKLDAGVIFTWQGAVLAAVVVAFPIMYRTARGALEQVDMNLIHAARTLGMTEVQIFFKILLPVARPGIVAATILAFARALGEFGATIMIAGNIPGKTQTMSLAIYTAMQSGNRELAYRWVAIIMTISVVTMILMNCIVVRRPVKVRVGGFGNKSIDVVTDRTGGER